MMIGMRSFLRLAGSALILAALASAAPPPTAPAAAAAADQNSATSRAAPEVRLRKLHLVRPDLIPYPLAYEVYC